jgi:DNA polymerase sigma
VLILINKSASFFKSASQRGEERPAKYLKRVVTGRDKDNSPQYRYLRTPEEVEAYERKHKKDKDEKKDTKETHEKQKREHYKIRKEAGGDKDPKSRDTDRKNKNLYILTAKDKKREDITNKVKKGLYVL